MVITGIIYAVLLADIDVNLNDTWVNSALHRILPLVMLLDWVFFASRHRISEARSLQWLLFPVIYAVYTLIRGPIVDWYPYPFMDPRHQRSEEHTSELQSLMRISYDAFCLKKKTHH